MASLGLLMKLEESGDRKRSPRQGLATGGSWTRVEVRVKEELSMLDLSPGDLRWLPSDSAWKPQHPGSESVMRSVLATRCRTVMKKRICI